MWRLRWRCCGSCCEVELDGGHGDGAPGGGFARDVELVRGGEEPPPPGDPASGTLDAVEKV